MVWQAVVAGVSATVLVLAVEVAIALAIYLVVSWIGRMR